MIHISAYNYNVLSPGNCSLSRQSRKRTEIAIINSKNEARIAKLFVFKMVTVICIWKA